MQNHHTNKYKVSLIIANGNRNMARKFSFYIQDIRTHFANTTDNFKRNNRLRRRLRMELFHIMQYIFYVQRYLNSFLYLFCYMIRYQWLVFRNRPSLSSVFSHSHYTIQSLSILTNNTRVFLMSPLFKTNNFRSFSRLCLSLSSSRMRTG